MRRLGYSSLLLTLLLGGCGGNDNDTPTQPVVTTLKSSTLKVILSEAHPSETFDLTTSPAGKSVGWYVKGKPYWLTLTPDHGTLSGAVKVTATAAPAPTEEPGNHADVLELAVDSGPVLNIAVQVFLLSTAHLVYSPTSLAIPAGSDTGRVTMTNDGRGTVSWRATSSVPWLHVVPPTSGFVGTQLSSVFEVVADRTSLPPGTSTGSISVLAGTDAVPTQIPVTVTVASPP